MLAKRGAPGSAAHAALRHEQATVAALPTHHALAKLAVVRLAALPQDRGVPSTAALLEPVSQEETAGSGVTAGTEMPPSIIRTVARTLEGTPEHLIAQGVVGSAEVLAELVPRIAAATVATAYPDAELQAVIAANYVAFRRRRSLLLLDLEHQVRVEELPWVRAVESYRTAGEETVASSRAALGRLTELTLTAFSATIVPSPLVTEMQTLAGEGGLDLPLLEELAADIFMGTFTSKFVRAAHCANELLHDSLYHLSALLRHRRHRDTERDGRLRDALPGSGGRLGRRALVRRLERDCHRAGPDPDDPQSRRPHRSVRYRRAAGPRLARARRALPEHGVRACTQAPEESQAAEDDQGHRLRLAADGLLPLAALASRAARLRRRGASRARRAGAGRAAPGVARCARPGPRRGRRSLRRSGPPGRGAAPARLDDQAALDARRRLTS